MTSKSKLATKFVQTRSFKFDPKNSFRLSSGILSPYYVDCKSLMASPDARCLVAHLAYEKIKNLPFDCIGGLEIGAIAIATSISDYGYHALADQKDWRTFVVRKQRKEHGLGKLIEGPVKPGDRVLVVDDVLTSGGSIIKAVNAVREADLKVEYALVIVDREEQDGRVNVEKEGITLLSLLTINDLQKAAGSEKVFA
jgi:orotate phosphoribosyltransferase